MHKKWNFTQAKSTRMLSDAQAQQIIDSPLSVQELADKFKLSYGAVYKIKKRRSYKHLRPSASEKITAEM